MHAILALALSLTAPALKDPPRNDVRLDGEWVVESQTTNGRSIKTTIEQVYWFTADGAWGITRQGRPFGTARRKFTLDPKSEPPRIDMAMSATAQPSMFGILKVEKDRLTLCYTRTVGDRPTRFEAPAGSNNIVIIFRRMDKD